MEVLLFVCLFLVMYIAFAIDSVLKNQKFILNKIEEIKKELKSSKNV